MTISHITNFQPLNIVFLNIIALVHFILSLNDSLELSEHNINTDFVFVV